ncbi:MAG: 30S ribosomal protein S20 [Candidatus Cloacimonetes bacterium]|nr:30S ribosomal protein S20 [Candidatus Cloacimonadota bacterium]MBL7085561.1 30S ribosomal protein S20 [Candidatus Cloacimonadota bacterium]
MPEHKSCKKRLRSDEKKRVRNKYVKKSINTMIKKLKKISNKTEMEKMLPKIYSLLDKAVKKGVIHKNNANRRKSRLANFVSKFEF